MVVIDRLLRVYRLKNGNVCAYIHSIGKKSVECTCLEYVYLLSICKKYTFYFYLSDFSATFACERVKA